MRGLLLVLTNPTGDEFARLTVPGVHFSRPGERGASGSRPNPEALYTAIETVLEAEGLTVALDPLDFRIAVSRGLILEAGTAEEVLLPLPIRLAGVEEHHPIGGNASRELNDFPSGTDPADRDTLADDGFDDAKEDAYE